jgi:hypothetical protein
MPKLTVLTDSSGKVIGTVRSDPVQTRQGTLQFHAPVTDKHTFHEIEVTAKLLELAPDELHAEVANHIPRT